ncbi:MAG: hypothetical protein R3C69_00890 [Geminicoccaceae bacterium]
MTARREVSPLAVLVHDRLEAEAALAQARGRGEAIELCVPAGLAGPAFVRALEETLHRELTALCDDEPGLVMAGLRAGLRRLVFSGPEPVRRRLAGMAAGLGAEVLASPPRSLVVPGSGGSWTTPAVCVSSAPTDPPLAKGTAP